MKTRHPPINTPSLGYFLPSYWKYLYHETVMGMFKMAATNNHETFFRDYMCSLRSAVET